MYVAVIPNRSSRPAILLRESYRDGVKVKNRTLANLSDWPPEQIETLRAALRGDKLVPAGEGMEIVRALPHCASSTPVSKTSTSRPAVGLTGAIPYSWHKAPG